MISILIVYLRAAVCIFDRVKTLMALKEIKVRPLAFRRVTPADVVV
jgi:hypothetical protein